MRSGKEWHPTESQLHHAWQLKMNGFTDVEIAEKLGVSPPTYSTRKLLFLRYFAMKRREDDRIKAARLKAMGVVPSKTGLDRYRLACVKLAELGECPAAIAKQIGVPMSTLHSWMEMDETFKHEIETARDRVDEEVIASLLKRAKGFTTREATTTEMSMGGVIAQRTTTRRVSRVLPSVKAQELWLTNRRKWLSENQGDNKPVADDRPIEYEIVDKLFVETNEKKDCEK